MITIKILKPECSGYLRICLSSFFPTSMARTRKLLKLVRDYGTRKDLDTIHEYLSKEYERHMAIGDTTHANKYDKALDIVAIERTRY